MTSLNSGAQDERTQNRRVEPDERAFAFCFDVLASAGSMGLAAVYSLLSPWGWTQSTVFKRLRELQDEGLVILDNTSMPDKHRRGEVRVTIEGEKVSNAYGIGSYRLREPNDDPQIPGMRGRPHRRTAPHHQPVEKESL